MHFILEQTTNKLIRYIPPFLSSHNKIVVNFIDVQVSLSN
jgi:hypothetical protein